MKAELIRVYGSDEVVVDAARVSFDKLAANYTNEQNEKLIKYLAKHNHWSPFAHVSIQMRETVPIFVARQRFKHRIGFEYNEVSRRYVDDRPEFYMPEVWRGKPINAKQGSSDEIIDMVLEKKDVTDSQPYNIDLIAWYDSFLVEAELLYSNMLEAGVAPEQARMVLPQSMYTSYIVTGSLPAWARAYKLRSDLHSQMEIQELAKQWTTIIDGIPELKYSWKALTEN